MNTSFTAALREEFSRRFGRPASALFAAAGRVEIIGNHTDHQRGAVVAASVDLVTAAAAGKNEDNVIRIFSQGFPAEEISLAGLTPVEEEKNTSAALIRGIAARFRLLGYEIGGFDAVIASQVPGGSGLSSSASYEVLLGTILSHLYNGGTVSPVVLAQVGQYAENVFFGKPCGLMDQLACSVGGCVFVDFGAPEDPLVAPLHFDPAEHGYEIYIVDSHASHAELTPEYAAIPEEMGAVSRALGKELLSQVPEAKLLAALPRLRRECGDRAVLRCLHYYREMDRVRAFRAAGECGDFDACLALLRASGDSSWELLQNVTPAGAVADQSYALTVALCRELAGAEGAVRPLGGGFAGTVLALIPKERTAAFTAAVDGALGAKSCRRIAISPTGGQKIE